MPRISKDKQAKTLAKMKERRQEDSRILRAVLEEKLKLCERERDYGKKKIQDLETTKRIVAQQVLRLEGAIEVIKQTLNPQQKESKPEDKTE